MLVAYLDEVAEAGAFVSKMHKNYNGSPAFGYAGFVIPSDQVRGTSQYFTEKKRAIQVQNSYAHVFNRTADPDHGEMRRLIESTMHVDSKLSANVQFADWVAAAVRRAFEYQLIEDSPFCWVPTAFEDLTRSKLTIESKLYFSHSRGGVREVHNSGIFARERPALAMSISQRLSPEVRTRMEEAKSGILAVARASGL